MQSIPELPTTDVIIANFAQWDEYRNELNELFEEIESTQLYDELLQYFDEPVEKTIERMKDIKNWVKTTDNTCTLGQEFGCSCTEDSDHECTNNQESYRLIGTEIYLCPTEIENNFDNYMKFDDDNNILINFIKRKKYNYTRQFDNKFKSFFQYIYNNNSDENENNEDENNDDENDEDENDEDENDEKEENSANN